MTDNNGCSCDFFVDVLKLLMARYGDVEVRVSKLEKIRSVIAELERVYKEETRNKTVDSKE